MANNQARNRVTIDRIKNKKGQQIKDRPLQPHKETVNREMRIKIVPFDYGKRGEDLAFSGL